MRALISRQVSRARQHSSRSFPCCCRGRNAASAAPSRPFSWPTPGSNSAARSTSPKPCNACSAGIRGEKPGPPSDGRAALGECPYRGLEFFDVAHADRFFGREAVTQWLVDDIRKPLRPGSELPRFLAILGASGSGKSSLARAGLYAELQERRHRGQPRLAFRAAAAAGPESARKPRTRRAPGRRRQSAA